MRQRKKFIIWGEMPLQIERKRSKLREIYRKLFVKNCYAGLASSTQTLKYFEYMNIKRRFLALLTVDRLDNITISRNKYKNKESWNLLYVGTIEHRKGIDLLLKTVELVQRRISEKVTIRLVGNPFGDINFVKEMQEYRHNEGIQFIAFTNNISKYYQEADLFLLFTRRDAHAIVIPEAMAHGLPIICSRYAGCVDDFIEDNGKIIDPNDIEKNAELIIGLMRNPLKLAASI
jgi:glycosyltransferase involved in cell wall biosynthesis